MSIDITASVHYGFVVQNMKTKELLELLGVEETDDNFESPDRFTLPNLGFEGLAIVSDWENNWNGVIICIGDTYSSIEPKYDQGIWLVDSSSLKHFEKNLYAIKEKLYQLRSNISLSNVGWLMSNSIS